MDLYLLIAKLHEIGFYNIILPFALFFSITFAVLKQFGVFRSDKIGNTIPALISFSVAMFTVLYTPFGYGFGTWLSEMFGKTGTVLGGLLVFIILIGLAGLDFPRNFTGMGKGKFKFQNVAVIFFILISVIIFYSSGVDDVTGKFGMSFDEETMLTFGMIGIMAYIVYMVTGGQNSKKGGKKYKARLIRKNEELQKEADRLKKKGYDHQNYLDEIKENNDKIAKISE